MIMGCKAGNTNAGRSRHLWPPRPAVFCLFAEKAKPLFGEDMLLKLEIFSNRKYNKEKEQEGLPWITSA